MATTSFEKPKRSNIQFVIIFAAVGLALVGDCLNQDSQDFRIFRIVAHQGRNSTVALALCLRQSPQSTAL